jgi:SAM-dependent methyltransferase
MMNWSELYAARNIVKKRFPSIWKLPLIKKEIDLLKVSISDGMKILEIGAGDRRIGSQLKELFPKIEYKSFDIDRSTSQDYYSLDEISDKFDVIYGFELIEHLSVEDGLEMLIKIRKFLKRNGILILGTPNLYHPHRYFGDLTHITPYKFEELGSLVTMAGYEVDSFYRKFNAPYISRLLRIYIFSAIHKLLDIDYANTIFMTAKLNHSD